MSDMHASMEFYRVVCDYCGDVWETVSPYATAVILAQRHEARYLQQASNTMHQVHVEEEQ